MTLIEAIAHANQVADSYSDTVPDCDTAKHYRQLAHWLYELLETKAENELLRELLRDYYDAPCVTCDPWGDALNCRHCDGGNCTLATRSIKLGIGAGE